MKTIWIVKYENTEIRVVNTWFNGEILFVNDEMQDEMFGCFSSDLSGHLIIRNGDWKDIKVNIDGAFTISFSVFIDDKKC